MIVLSVALVLCSIILYLGAKMASQALTDLQNTVAAQTTLISQIQPPPATIADLQAVTQQIATNNSAIQQFVPPASP